MRKVIYLTLILAILVVGWYSYSMYGQKKSIKIFSAGSLSIPLQEVGRIYETDNDIKVEVEVSGSLEAIRKITDLNKRADIIAVADYRLLGDLLYPKYIDWYVAFASNEMVIAYTDNSRYSKLIESNPMKWVDILLKDDVKYGFANPNKDPCGYRSLGVIALESLKKENYTIFDKLVSQLSNIKYDVSDNGIIVSVPSDLKVLSERLVIRSKSIDLISLLEAGSIDYAFEYKSVAIQHNLKYIELPTEVNLKSPGYDEWYSKVYITLLTGTDKQYTLRLKSIVYGISVLKDSENREEAIAFIKLLLSEKGREIFKELGQDFLSSPIFYGNPPSELRK